MNNIHHDWPILKGYSTHIILAAQCNTINTENSQNIGFNNMSIFFPGDYFRYRRDGCKKNLQLLHNCAVYTLLLYKTN